MNLSEFMAGLRRMESGSFEGDYTIASNPSGPYRGAYQIHNDNWALWAQEAGLGGAVWTDRVAQNEVAAHRLQGYYDYFGDWGLVAMAWHDGRAGTSNFLAALKAATGREYQGTQDMKLMGYDYDYSEKVLDWANEWAGIDPADKKYYALAPSAADPIPQRTPQRQSTWTAGIEQQPFNLGDPDPAMFGQEEEPGNPFHQNIINWMSGLSNSIAGGTRNPDMITEYIQEDIEKGQPDVV